MAFTDRLANRGSISTGAYEIENSIRLEAMEPEELYYTTGSASSDHDKGTFAFWMKKGERGHFSPMQINDFAGPYHSGMYFQSGTGNLADRLYMSHKDNDSSWTSWQRQFRDHSAWYHFVIRVDTTLAEGDDRIQLWVNGVRETVFNFAYTAGGADYFNAPPGQNDAHFWFDTGRKMTVGGVGSGDGYFADYYYIDGQSVAPSEFGEFDEDSGIWVPKKYGGTYGNNGFKLEFKETGTSANASGIGADTSGNGHHFTLTGIGAQNQTTDTPTNNFCVLNPEANNNYDSPSGTLEMGGCRVANAASSFTTYLGTTPFSSGKWYWEMEDMGSYTAAGILSVGKEHLLYEVSGAEGIAYRTWNGGALAKDGNADASTGLGAPDSNNWVWGFWVDMDNGKFTVKNLSGSGTPTVIDEVDIGKCFDNGRMVIPFVRVNAGSSVNINFGNGRWRSDNMMGWYDSFNHSGRSDDNDYGTFEYYPNANSKSYYSLCTKNLAEFG